MKLRMFEDKDGGIRLHWLLTLPPSLAFGKVPINSVNTLLTET